MSIEYYDDKGLNQVNNSKMMDIEKPSQSKEGHLDYNRKGSFNTPSAGQYENKTDFNDFGLNNDSFHNE